MNEKTKETTKERTPFDILLAQTIILHVEDGLELTEDRIYGMIDLARLQTR